MISTGWDYSDLTKIAKEYGGPANFISKVASLNYKRGCIDQLAKDGIGMLIITANIIPLWEGGKYIINRVKNYKAISTALKMESDEASREFVEVMKKADDKTIESTTADKKEE